MEAGDIFIDDDIVRTIWKHIEVHKRTAWKVTNPCEHNVTNISYYDHTYFTSLFGDFCYPDGTKPEWKAVDTLQRMFMKYFNKLRTKQILTFPVNYSAA